MPDSHFMLVLVLQGTRARTKVHSNFGVPSPSTELSTDLTSILWSMSRRSVPVQGRSLHGHKGALLHEMERQRGGHCVIS
jgi:hypothetical protein